MFENCSTWKSLYLRVMFFVWFDRLAVICLPVTNMMQQNDKHVKLIAPYSSSSNFGYNNSVVAQSKHFDKYNATIYLQQYGYLPQFSDDGSTSLTFSNEDFEQALRTFQKFADIAETGSLDTATIQKMKTPRCGMKDVDEPTTTAAESNHLRHKRYAIEGSYWGVKDITYQVTKYASQVPPAKVDFIIERAFKVWEEFSPLKFVKRDGGAANIEIMFGNRDHGDGEPFDGKGGILAHAFFPRYGGDVHFDDEESWRADTRGETKESDSRFWRELKKVAKFFRTTFQSFNGIDLYSVAAHEIGHALGLKHSQDNQALMAPFYQGYNGDAIHLRPDDIRGLQHLYGLPSDRNEEFGIIDTQITDNLLPNDNNPNSQPAINFNICNDPSLDALTVLGNGTTYAFKGNLYWRLNQLSFDDGYPRNITQDWDGLPGDLDAAVTDYDGDTYFFKGDSYWLYDPHGRRYRGYPRKIAVGLVDTPNNLDAAMIWNYDDKPYFFKGDKFWQYSRWGLPSGWPKLIREISHELPNKIDAALKWTNGKTYLFAGHYYYRLTGWRVMKVVKGYPRPIGEWWFGCPKTNAFRNKRQLSRNYREK